MIKLPHKYKNETIPKLFQASLLGIMGQMYISALVSEFFGGKLIEYNFRSLICSTFLIIKLVDVSINIARKLI